MVEEEGKARRGEREGRGGDSQYGRIYVAEAGRRAKLDEHVHCHRLLVGEPSGQPNGQCSQ